MPALRMIGLVVMGALVISIGALGFFLYRAAELERAAHRALRAVGNACEKVIAGAGNQVVENLYIPEGYLMRLVDNVVKIDGDNFPRAGFSMRFVEFVGFADVFDNTLELRPGTHHLSIRRSESGLVVENLAGLGDGARHSAGLPGGR